MNNFATLLESEMKQAILKQDENAIKRVSLIVAEKIEKVEDIEETQTDIRSDIKVIAEVMKKGFEDMNQRFEDMNQRFEDMNQRIAELREDMNQRFENMNQRIIELRDDMNRRFNMIFAFMSIGFTIITGIMVLFKFLR